jgi:hypothetical protein
VAYLRAVEAATPAWRDIDAAITAEGLNAQGLSTIYKKDLRAQVDADAPFLTALRAIDFPTPAQAARGRDLIAAIQAYDDYLKTGYAPGGTLMNFPSEDERLVDARSQSSARLRDALSLPPSTCSYLRP